MEGFEQVWRRVGDLAGERFETVTGKSFSYDLRSGGVRLRNTDRMLLRSNFERAWARLPVSGPGALQDLQGPSYIYAILTDPRVRRSNANAVTSDEVLRATGLGESASVSEVIGESKQRSDHEASRLDHRLQSVAALLRERNAVDAKLAEIIGRPPEKGHLGEWLALQLLPLEPAPCATQVGWDAIFTLEAGALAGKTVNVKWYGKREGLLDVASVSASVVPDYYLVFAGPKSTAMSSRGGVRPLCIASVHLFDHRALVRELDGRRIGIATSVREALWAAAEIFPESHSSELVLSDQQREFLNLFRPDSERP